MAKMVDAPIFHVNGDDPESVVLVTELAMEYRNKFRKDVVIDIVCYRRFGHNEGDEPMFTQPLMYNNIAKHPTVSRSYEGRLIAEGVITSEEAERSRSKFREVLDNAFAEVGSYKPEKADCFGGVWDGLMRPKPGHFQDYISDTGVEEDKLLFLAKAISTLPEWFTPNAKIAKVIENRLEGVGKGAIDWGMAESLAFASLLAENYKVRLSGEDCGPRYFFT